MQKWFIIKSETEGFWYVQRLHNRKQVIYLKNKRITSYPLLAVEDSFFRYLRLFLESIYVKAANTTNKSVSTSNVFIQTSFPFPERTTADYPHLL